MGRTIARYLVAAAAGALLLIGVGMAYASVGGH